MSDMLKMQLTDTSARILADMAKYPEQVEREVEKELDAIGLDIRNNIMLKMSKTTRGGELQRRGGGKSGPPRWVRASLPGKPPAPDQSNLINSFEIYRVGGVLEVGTNILYAKFLEKGTRKMAARPFLQAGMGGVNVENLIRDAISRGFAQ